MKFVLTIAIAMWQVFVTTTDLLSLLILTWMSCCDAVAITVYCSVQTSRFCDDSGSIIEWIVSFLRAPCANKCWCCVQLELCVYMEHVMLHCTLLLEASPLSFNWLSWSRKSKSRMDVHVNVLGISFPNIISNVTILHFFGLELLRWTFTLYHGWMF